MSIRDELYTQHERWRAYAAVKRAIESGKLKRPDVCEKCGKRPRKISGRSQIQAHHGLGYDKNYVLDVEWLCVSCNNLAKEREDMFLKDSLSSKDKKELAALKREYGQAAPALGIRANKRKQRSDADEEAQRYKKTHRTDHR